MKETQDDALAAPNGIRWYGHCRGGYQIDGPLAQFFELGHARTDRLVLDPLTGSAI